MRVRAWCLAGTLGWVSVASAQEGLTLEELERRALANNPTLVQAEAQVTAAVGRVDQAGRWPNPTIGYTAEEVSNSPTIRGGEHGIFIEQVFPISGRLGATQSVREQELAQQAAVRDAQRIRVLTQVRMLFYDAVIAAQRVQVHAELAALSDEAVAVSGRLMNVGAADLTDVMASEIEAARATLALAQAQATQRRIWQRLGLVIGDPSLTPQPIADGVEQMPPVIEYDAILATLLEESPELRAVRADVDRSQSRLHRARLEPRPDLIVRAGPRYNRELLDPGPSPVGWEFFADVGVSIPLWNRNQGEISAAQAEARRADAEVTRLELVLQTRLADVFERYSRAMAQVHAYRETIVPRATEAHKVLLSRYQEMAAAYPQVLIAQRTVFQVTQEYLDALATGWHSALLMRGLLLDGGLEAPASVGEPVTDGAP